jgi:uracil-DNA glycosylase
MGTAPAMAAGLDQLRAAAAGCTNCDLWRNATQTVFGQGDPHARVMLVGEQPGDREDLEGAPFVGPAGRLLDDALVDAGIDRAGVYVTNAVKHFKWTPRGKRRIHQKPNATEMAACRPWLEGELEVVRPALVVALGATAVQTLLGSAAKVMRDRGRTFEGPKGVPVGVTIHPSAILRADDDARPAQYEQFVDDLRGFAGT